MVEGRLSVLCDMAAGYRVFQKFENASRDNRQRTTPHNDPHAQAKCKILDLMDVEWLIHHLCFDESFSQAEIDIDIYDDDVWDRLLQGLTRRRLQLKRLEINRSEYLRRSPENLEDLFRVISDMPRLRSLELMNFSAFDMSTGQDYFANFLGLEELEIMLSDESITSLSDEVSQSIASMPQLSHISITATYRFAVSNILSPRIEKVYVEPLDDVPFRDDHFNLLMEDLRTDRFSRLKILELPRLTVQNHQIPLLTKMLKENTTLEELSLSLSIPATHADECCEEIIDAMSHNNVLRSFLNHFWQKIEQNVSSATKTMQNEMLQRNTTLEKFNLFEYRTSQFQYDDESSLTDTVRQKNLFLRLNKAGRKRLTDVGTTGSVNDWIDVISHEAVRDHLPCLFYLLRMNPSLCLGGYCPTRQQLDTAAAGSETESHVNSEENDEDSSRPTKRQCR